MHLHTTIRRIGTLAALAGLPLTAALGTASASIQATSNGVMSHATAPPRAVQKAPATPKGATAMGAVSGSTSITGQVVLKPRDESGLQAFIANASNKKSPTYRHYLTKGAFAADYGPSAATLNATEAALKAGGLTVKSVAADHMFVTFTGTATKVEKTFGTGLAKYRLAGGRIGTATTSTVKLPASLAPQVTAVLGLDSLVSENPEGIRRGSNAVSHPAAGKAKFTPPTGSANPANCPQNDAAVAASEFGGLTDDQVAHAYGADGLYSNGDFGAGQNIAVFELEPFDASDLSTFDTCYFGATKAATMTGNVTNTPVDGGQPAGPGSGESILDVEDVSAIAPDANIHVYTAPNSTFGAIDEYSQIINNDVDQELTTSWGECEQTIQQGAPGQQQAENLLFQQAAAQGMTVFSAAGDEGSDDCNMFETDTPVSPVLSVDDPSSQPYVVAVGGTTVDDATQPASEHVWNDGAEWGAGGGGISQSWTMPAWQKDATVPGIDPTSVVSNADSIEGNDLGINNYKFCGSESLGGSDPAEACRELPDVSADADEFTGAITIYSASFGDNEADSWITIGGTSSAAPLWAGMLALINASGTGDCTAAGSGTGFALPGLYAVASNASEYAASFSDITAGNNDPYGSTEEFPTATGYDLASGLGTPQLTGPNGTTGLAFNLCNLGTGGTRPAVTSLTPTVVPKSGGVLTITGTGFADGDAVTIGAFKIPAGAVNVNGAGTSISTSAPASDLLSAAKDTSDGSGRYQVTVTSPAELTSATSAASLLDYVNTNGGDTVPTVTSVLSYGGPDSGNNSVTIYGSGFTGITNPMGVTFGGVAAVSYTVVNDNKITAVVPPFDSGNTICTQSGALPDEDASNDVCQTQVIVTNSNGSSATSTIKPLFEGDYVLSPIAAVETPSDQEAAPANTEYDYFAPPAITSVSTTESDPNSLASENGGTVITITGTGFNDAGLAEVLIGAPSDANSEDTNLTFVSGTEIQIQAPAEDNTVDAADIPIEIHTLAGQSGSSNVVYAGNPTVSAIDATSGPTAGKNGGPDSGGTAVAITGTGFSDANLITWVDLAGPLAPGFPPASVGTQYNFNAPSSTSITANTVSENPGVVDTEVCTVTACSDPNDNDVFLLFPPGAPSVTAVSPTSGPSGTEVAITGANLGCASSVKFGSTTAEAFDNAAALLDCGQTGEVDVLAPVLPPGTHVPVTVPVKVETVESDLTGDAATSTATFKFTAAKPAFVAKAPAPPAGTVGKAYSYTLAVSGTPGPTFAVSSGALPPGVHLGATTGKLSGTPTAGGKFSFTVKLTNPSGTASKAFTVSVTGAPKFTKDKPPAGKVGKAYSYAFVASGGPTPTYKVTSGSLPKGLTLGSGGVLKGKPTKAGTYHFKVIASNGHKPNAVTPNLTVTIKKA